VPDEWGWGRWRRRGVQRCAGERGSRAEHDARRLHYV
jgi:hypothetical protein